MQSEVILDTLERLAASEHFSRSKRLLRFLRFTVDHTLNGAADSLSEYTIGRHVYDRTEDFDPLTDGIVRVEAHRLRSKLRDYYKSAGRQDRLIFEYPVGSYVPTFRYWAPEFLPEHGQMSQIIRSYDWSTSPLGPMANWPGELKAALNLCLRMKFPSSICWLPDHILLYNDAMHAVLDKEGTNRIGHTANYLEPDNGAAFRLAIENVRETKEAVLWEKTLWLTELGGEIRESYFTTSFSPITDSGGSVAGVLIVAMEVTDAVLNQRRNQIVMELAVALQMTGEDNACREAMRILENGPHDIPFAAIYLFDASKANAEFRGGAGIRLGTGATPEKIPLKGDSHPLAAAIIAARPEILQVGRLLGPLPCGPWKSPPREVAVLPLRATRERDAIGVLVAGINPHRAVDAEYRAFLEASTKQISGLIFRSREHGRERKLTAEMEQQKRTWASFLDFASEEFRTPLTIVLGLLDKIMGESGVNGPLHSTLTTTRRSALRLWNATDTLMDLIRVQTDRLEPVFSPVNLSAATEEVARAFAAELARPAIRFALDCPPLGEDVYVDRRLWDRLILNLLVSAVHRMDDGDIGISIRKIGAWVDIAVWDTGIAIPEQEKPLVFEPFRPGERLGSRAGLALARHFVARHGGHVTVESESGKGNKFVVSLPRGRSHLSFERVMETPAAIRASIHSLHAYVEDAARWAPERATGWERPLEIPDSEPAWQKRDLAPQPRRKVLVAVSDRDLRQYLSNVVRELYLVETADSGVETLRALERISPDLLLLDAELRPADGFDVLRAVRGDANLGSLPIVLISPHSSEEDRLGAFAAGASDYLIKPISASELLVRLESQIALADRHRALLDRQENVLRDAAQLDLLRAVVDQLPIGVAIADRLSRNLVVKNRRVQEIFGDIAGQINSVDDIPEVFGTRPDGTLLHRSDCALIRAVDHGEITVDEPMIYAFPEGRAVSLSVSASPIQSTAGTHIGAVILYRPLLRVDAKLLTA